MTEFRSRLVAGLAEEKILPLLLEKGQERKWLTASGRQRTDFTPVLGAIRALNRLECVGETLRHALNSLAVVAPGWLKVHSQPEWVEHYGRRVDDYHLPKSQDERQAYACLMRTHSGRLLEAVYAPKRPLGWRTCQPSKPYGACGPTVLSDRSGDSLADRAGRFSAFGPPDQLTV